MRWGESGWNSIPILASSTNRFMGSAFENALEIMIVVLIQPLQLLRFSGADQLSFHKKPDAAAEFLQVPVTRRLLCRK